MHPKLTVVRTTTVLRAEQGSSIVTLQGATTLKSDVDLRNLLRAGDEIKLAERVYTVAGSVAKAQLALMSAFQSFQLSSIGDTMDVRASVNTYATQLPG